MRATGIDAGLRVQPAPGEVPGRARAPRLQPRLRFRGHQPHDLLRPVPARQLVLRRHRACLRRAAAGQGARDPGRRCATRCRRRSSPTPYQNPVNGSPEKVRANLREAVRLLNEAGYELRDQRLVDKSDRRALRGRVPRLRHEPRALRPALRPGARADRHHDVDPHRRRGAVPEPAAQLRLRRDHRSLGRRRCRPATSSASSGAPRPPTGRARATPPASRNAAVDALIEKVIFARDRDELVAADEGARPRAPPPRLRRAAMSTRIEPCTARWNRFGKTEAPARIRRLGLPDDLVVRCREGRQDRSATMTEKLRSPSPASERSRGDGTPVQDMARGRERAPSPRLRERVG